MTLKCKIKEVSELNNERDVLKYQDQLNNKDSDSDFSEYEEVEEGSFSLHEVGTIEEISIQKAQQKLAA
jgi:hypothetical protein